MIKEIIGRKLGMTQIFDEEGNLVGTSVLEVEPVCVFEKVTYPKGVRAKIGCLKIPKVRQVKVAKPLQGYFKKVETEPYAIIREVEFSDESAFEAKAQVGLDIFEVGEKVHVQAKTKGRGFQGGMRRHGWSGQNKTHGSTTHRRIGSAGATTFPGRVIKGLRMPGHMGNSKVTVKNLKVLKIEKEKNLLFLKGAVPGFNGAVVSIKKVC